MTTEFARIKRLPPYVFNVIGELKQEARAKGEDIIDLSMGNPDQPTPPHILEKMIEVSRDPKTHRYSQSKGIPRLRKAICDWYDRRYDVTLNPETEAIVTIGSKEGLAHLALATMERGDSVIVPNPAYPIHPYGFVIAGADILHVPLYSDDGTGQNTDCHEAFFEGVVKTLKMTWPKPKMLLLNFPANPTTDVVELEFFERVVAIAKEHKIWVVQDLAYADIVFDGYQAPSILQVEGAKDVAVEFYSLSKSYNMPGWRLGFCVGNKTLIHALGRIKSYLDYGIFTPLQVAGIAALEGPQDCVKDICQMYKERRDRLCEGLNQLGWPVKPPKATMFVWAPIPEAYRHMGSLEFSKWLLKEAKVAVSPGIGFGEYGDKFVRLALIENEHRTRQALRGIKKAFAKGPPN